MTVLRDKYRVLINLNLLPAYPWYTLFNDVFVLYQTTLMGRKINDFLLMTLCVAISLFEYT